MVGVVLFLIIVVGSAIAVQCVPTGGSWLYLPYFFSVAASLLWCVRWVRHLSAYASKWPAERDPITLYVLVPMGFVVLTLLFAVGMTAAHRLGSPITVAEGYCGGTSERPTSVAGYWYVALITVTTVGYASLNPDGAQAKLLVCVEIVIFSVFLTSIALVFQRVFESRSADEMSPGLHE